MKYWGPSARILVFWKAEQKPLDLKGPEHMIQNKKIREPYIDLQQISAHVIVYSAGKLHVLTVSLHNTCGSHSDAPKYFPHILTPWAHYDIRSGQKV